VQAEVAFHAEEHARAVFFSAKENVRSFSAYRRMRG